MVLFSTKKIGKQGNIGEVLRKKREQMGWSVHQLSRWIAVAERYVEAIEAEEWERLPGEVYIRNFLRRYASEVDLEPQRVEKAYQQHSGMSYSTSISSLQRTLPLPAKHFMILPKYIRNGFVVLGICAVLAYLGWQANMYFSPPSLVVFSPTDDLITSQPTIELRGQTDPEVEVTVNDIPISVNAGSFSENLDLQSGINVLKITATKKQGIKSEIYRKVMWRANDISKN